MAAVVRVAAAAAAPRVLEAGPPSVVVALFAPLLMAASRFLTWLGELPPNALRDPTRELDDVVLGVRKFDCSCILNDMTSLLLASSSTKHSWRRTSHDNSISALRMQRTRISHTMVHRGARRLCDLDVGTSSSSSSSTIEAWLLISSNKTSDTSRSTASSGKRFEY